MLHVRYCPAEQPPRPFTYKSEVEATDAKSEVVVAFVMSADVAPKLVVVAFVVRKFVEKRLPAVKAVEDAFVIVL